MRNVLHVSAGSAPRSKVVGKKDGGSSVSEALHKGEEPVQMISRTIHHRQPQDDSSNVGAVQDSFFNGDLVIVFVHPTENVLQYLQVRLRVELSIRSDGRVLGDGQ